MKRGIRHQKPDPLRELVVEIKLDAHCSFFLECLAEQIVHRAATSDELRNRIREAVESMCFGDQKPAVVRLHLVRDEMLTVG